MPKPPQNLNQFSSLVQIIKDLRGPEGCPWDREQDHQTLAPYAIEETFELTEAIDSNDDRHICEELGDVLFQVILHSQLASERGAFSINDVIDGISQKIVRRHPHVFADVKVSSTDDIIANWNEIKEQEKKGKPQPLFKAPKGLPALMTADEIGRKTQKLSFDWDTALDVLNQLKAEIKELEDELLHPDQNANAIEHELGDVLFSAAQLARHLEIEPESALRKTNIRFQKRFNHMLNSCENNLENFKNLSASQKEVLWKNAKLIN